MTDQTETDSDPTESYPANTEAPAAEASERVVDYYWRPGCPFCMSLKHSLDRAGITLRPFNIWDDPGAAAAVRDATGGSETVPTISFGGDYLVNPRPAEVLNLIATHDPDWAHDLVGDQPPKRRWFKRG